MLALREDEDKAEARRDLAVLHALRAAVPACFDDKNESQEPYRKREADLIARANGKPVNARRPRRWAPSKKRKPV